MKFFLALTVVAMLTAFLPILNGCSGSRKAERIGLVDSHLRPCPDSPNCVSSEAVNVKHQVEPFLDYGQSGAHHFASHEGHQLRRYLSACGMSKCGFWLRR